MDTHQKLAKIALVVFNLLILLYINFAAQMPPVVHLVLIPLLILETLALGGFALEKPRKIKKTSLSQIRHSRETSQSLPKIKSAA